MPEGVFCCPPPPARVISFAVEPLPTRSLSLGAETPPAPPSVSETGVKQHRELMTCLPPSLGSPQGARRRE